MDHAAASAQLTDELGAIAVSLAALLGADLAALLTSRAQDAADRLTAQLTGPDADATAADLLSVLWPHSDPDPTWWASPLGLLIAPWWAATHAEEGWTRAQAAAVLGVTAGTVATLTSRGTLTQRQDGRVSVPSVISRLVRLAGRTAS